MTEVVQAAEPMLHCQNQESGEPVRQHDCYKEKMSERAALSCQNYY
jgi:hypothetical protein